MRSLIKVRWLLISLALCATASEAVQLGPLATQVCLYPYAVNGGLTYTYFVTNATGLAITDPFNMKTDPTVAVLRATAPSPLSVDFVVRQLLETAKSGATPLYITTDGAGQIVQVNPATTGLRCTLTTK